MLYAKLIRHIKLQSMHFYHKNIQQYRNVRLRQNEDITFIGDIINLLASYKQVIAVAAGPSANATPRNSSSLYITTNASYKLALGLPQIYFVSEAFYLEKYLKYGPFDDKCLAVAIRHEISSGSKSLEHLARRVLLYKHKYERDIPEIFVSDVQKYGPFHRNYEELENHCRENLSLKFKQFNSGFGLVQTAYYIASKIQKPLAIYGMDAGTNGSIHFDGTLSQSNAVEGNRVRRKLTALLNALEQQNIIEVSNYSYFQPEKLTIEEITKYWEE